MMKPFTTLTSRAVPLLRDNIDTDTIIPSREIKSVSKHGLAAGLFAGWRYTNIGGRTENAEFIMNKSVYKGASILLGGANFGCGSSREHAVWALADYGFRVVIAASFNPIFRGNCIRNGLLPIALDTTLLAQAAQPLTIDLPAQCIKSAIGEIWSFEIDADSKELLVDGLDMIGLTLRLQETISDFRMVDQQARPWVYFEDMT